MADFEDANAPTWENLVVGQANLIDAIEHTIRIDTPEKTYKLHDKVAVLLVRPRGWHLAEKHVLVDGHPMSGSLFDFGMYVFHNGQRLRSKGMTPAFYLPKMESHLEARLWDEVFTHAEETLGLRHGTLKATVLIETILAAFEMEEILHELRDHAAGLNAGRWDYLFSAIKKFRNRPEMLLPDRAQLTMTTPFMRAYTELLVKTCHKRGAFAMGGMAAFIPNRKDPAVTENALAKVRDDKTRESRDGFDGTWVAHPDLVPVATEIFDKALGDKPNQLDRQRPEVNVQAKQILDFHVPGGKVTEAGLRNNVEVGIRYLEAWLRGNGAVAIHNLMEDAATAEISRSQVWQWTRQKARLDDGREVTPALVRAIVDEESAKLQREGLPKLAEARTLFERVALASDFPEFLTLPAYEHLE
jgi:malate synthase